MMLMFFFLVVLFLVARSSADITGSNPANGACLCSSGSSVNVRTTACGDVIGQINIGQCFKYQGTKETCVLGGVAYEFFQLEYGSGSGWVAGTQLDNGAASECFTPTGCPRIVTRAEWGARAPTSISYISHPIPLVVVHHTDTTACTTEAECFAIVRAIQNYHMDSLGLTDINLNFLVGEDGNAYEGRGFDVVGDHADGWNTVSLGISVIGSFMNSNPNLAAQYAVQQLISCATTNGKVSGSYSLHGHKDAVCTDCPGAVFYELIKTWPRYGGQLPGGCSLGEA